MTQEKQAPQPTGMFAGLFGTLKDAIFEEPAAKGKATLAAAPQAPTVAAGAVPQVGAVAPAQAVNPMVEAMEQMVMSKTTAYTALVEAISPLEAYIPDEGSRYKAAFATVGKTRTLEQIVQAIDMQHIQALDAESQRFTSQARGQEEAEITTRTREAQTLRTKAEAQITESTRLRAEMEERIAALQASAAGHTREAAAKEQEVSTKRAEIDQVNAQFTQAVAIVKDRLLQAKAKVIKHLGA
jgi:chromosome segregation ATPase